MVIFHSYVNVYQRVQHVPGQSPPAHVCKARSGGMGKHLSQDLEAQQEAKSTGG